MLLLSPCSVLRHLHVLRPAVSGGCIVGRLNNFRSVISFSSLPFQILLCHMPWLGYLQWELLLLVRLLCQLKEVMSSEVLLSCLKPITFLSLLSSLEDLSVSGRFLQAMGEVLFCERDTLFIFGFLLLYLTLDFCYLGGIQWMVIMFLILFFMISSLQCLGFPRM